MRAILIFAIVFVIVQCNVTNAKRILFIAHVPSYSHQISYRRICLELNRRGHEIVSVTTNPIKNASLTNYTEIDLHYFYDGFTKYKNIPYKSLTDLGIHLSFLKAEEYIWQIIEILTEELYKNPSFQKLYAADSNEHFDLIIAAQGPALAQNALAYRFNAPLIGISSLDVLNHFRFIFGSPILPSHLSNWQTNIKITKNMSFWQRLVNFYEVWRQLYKYMTMYLPIQEAIVKKYLGSDVPNIYDITKNMSVYLVNRHPILSFARAEQPNIIFYHGSHINDVPPALPTDLKQYLDNAKEGFIYVSLGSNVKWDHLPSNLLDIFFETFVSLPYKVLWKCDSKMPRKDNNVLVMKWLPQQAVLAHPNIKLFFYQGGIQSSEEATYYGIPMIGFPIFWDQTSQIHKMEHLGICIGLHFKNLTKEILTTAIHEVINNKRYKERAKELSKLYKDQPYDGIQSALWWIEYVMRHNGEPILRDSISDQPWYKQHDWDIIVFIVVTAFIISFIFLYALFRMLYFICRFYQNRYCETQCNSIKSKEE